MIGSVLQETRGIRRRLASERRSLGCLDVWTGRTLLTIFIGMFVPQSPFRPRTILFSKAALAPRQRFGRVVRGMRWIGHVSQHRFSRIHEVALPNPEFWVYHLIFRFFHFSQLIFTFFFPVPVSTGAAPAPRRLSLTSDSPQPCPPRNLVT